MLVTIFFLISIFYYTQTLIEYKCTAHCWYQFFTHLHILHRLLVQLSLADTTISDSLNQQAPAAPMQLANCLTVRCIDFKNTFFVLMFLTLIILPSNSEITFSLFSKYFNKFHLPLLFTAFPVTSQNLVQLKVGLD